MHKTELVGLGKYHEQGNLREPPRVNLPLQVMERVNESRATREARKMLTVPQGMVGKIGKCPACGEMKRRNRMKRLIATVGVLSVLMCAGCASASLLHVKVDALTTSEAQTAKKYVLLPGQEGLSSEDLRFKEFCVYVDRALASKGFIKAEGSEPADVALFLSYGIGEPEKQLYSVPTWGETGVSSSTTFLGPGPARTYYQPSYGITGYRYGTRLIYTRWFSLVACQLHLGEGKAKEFWRIEARSAGSSDDLRRVFPVLLAAARPYLAESTPKKSVTVKLKEDDQEVICIRDGRPPRVWTKSHCPNCGLEGIEFVSFSEFYHRRRSGARSTVFKRVRSGRYWADANWQVPWCKRCKHKTPQGVGVEQ